jgi:hypothetical protein
MATSTDLLQGTLDLSILKTLDLEPMHGVGIGQRIQQVSKEALQIGQGLTQLKRGKDEISTAHAIGCRPSKFHDHLACTDC